MKHSQMRSNNLVVKFNTYGMDKRHEAYSESGKRGFANRGKY